MAAHLGLCVDNIIVAAHLGLSVDDIIDAAQLEDARMTCGLLSAPVSCRVKVASISSLTALWYLYGLDIEAAQRRGTGT